MKNIENKPVTDILSELIENDPRIAEHIKNNTRFVVAGYSTDYILFTTDSGIEFILSMDLNGNTIGIDYHFSEDYVATMRLGRIISEKGTSHMYSMSFKKNPEEEYPVKVVCPDVLAAPKKNDLIDGQLMAFSAGEVDLLDFSVYPEGLVKRYSPETVIIEGEISDGYAYDFELFENRFTVWELLVKAKGGIIPVILTAEDGFEPEIGDFLRTEALLAIDVAIDRESQCEQPLHDAWGLGSSFNSPLLSADGLVPNLRNAERVLSKSLEEGSLERFGRCISKELPIDEANRLRVLMDGFGIETFPAHITECGDETLIGHSAVAVKSISGDSSASVYDGETAETVAYVVLDIDEYGFVDKIRIISPAECSIGYDSELNALTSIARAVKNGKAGIIKEYLADKCVLHSQDNTIVMGLSGIRYFLENLVSEVSDRSDIVLENVLSDDDSDESAVSEENSRQSHMVRIDIAGKVIGLLSAKVNTRGLVTDLYFSQTSY